MLGCDYCKGEKPIFDKGGLKLRIDGDELHAVYYVGLARIEAPEPITHCPKCGCALKSPKVTLRAAERGSTCWGRFALVKREMDAS